MLIKPTRGQLAFWFVCVTVLYAFFAPLALKAARFIWHSYSPAMAWIMEQWGAQVEAVTEGKGWRRNLQGAILLTGYVLAIFFAAVLLGWI